MVRGGGPCAKDRAPRTAPRPVTTTQAARAFHSSKYFLSDSHKPGTVRGGEKGTPRNTPSDFEKRDLEVAGWRHEVLPHASAGPEQARWVNEEASQGTADPEPASVRLSHGAAACQGQLIFLNES